MRYSNSVPFLERTRYRYSLTVLASCLAMAVPSSLWASPTIPYSHGEPTNLEQYMLELINRARANPTAEGIRLDTVDTDFTQYARQQSPEYFTNLQQEFTTYPVAQPLAFNSQLLQAARLHSQDMVERNYFSHGTPEGLAPWDRMKNQGYQGNSFGENIDGGGASTADDIFWSHWGFMVDCFNASTEYHDIGHRLNVLKTDFNEIGVGNFTTSGTDGHITQDFGTASDRIFLLGVVYQDQNGNHFYDPGEGLGGVTVMPSEGDYYAVTSAAGGYAIPLVATETRELNVPTSLAYNASTPEQRQNEYQTFRDNYLADPANQTPLKLQVNFSGGALTTPVMQEVTLLKPVLVDAKFTYSGGSWWMSPFMAGGTNVKLDLDTSAAVPPPTKNNTNNTSSLPTLGQNFNGGIAVNGQAHQTQATLNLSDTVEVVGDILVNAADVGKTADIFVYAEATLPPSPETVYFMLGEGLTISAWDKNPNNLVVFQPNVTLDALQSVLMYSGNFVYPGTLKVYFGYRLADGTLVQNGQPIDIVINDNTIYFTAGYSDLKEVSDGAKIYYMVSGGKGINISKGTPLLLIHGGEFTDEGQPKGSSSWDPQYQELSQHFKIILLDLRGFGQSTLVGEHPLDSWVWTETEHRATTDVVELLNALGIPKAHVLGLSIGSAVAAQLAVFHPEMVDKLILASPWWMNTLPTNPVQMQKLNAIIDKTLFIGGVNDFQYSMELMSGEMAGYFPKAEVIENADHFCNRDQPAEFNRLVLDFLANTANNVDSCTYEFEPTDGLSFSEQIQYGKTTVTTQDGCQWTASSNTDWITLISGSSGNGTDIVTYAVAPNLGSDLKTGTVTVAGKTLTITVPTRPISDASCSYEVSPTSLSLPVEGDSGIINVTTQPGCDWAASSDTDWVKIEWIAINHENGTGSVVYTADPNTTSSPKTGILTVAGKTVTATISSKPDSTEPVDPIGFLTLPNLKNYTFTGEETKILPGMSVESACDGTITKEDQIGRLALVALFYQNWCYTDGRYNHNDYQVDRGTISDTSQLRFDAYRIYEPARKASDFLASQHAVYYRFPTQEDYTVYSFDGDSINKVLEIPASQIDTNQFVKLENLTVSSIKNFATYLFVPSQQRVSTFTELAPGIEGARIGQNVLGEILKYRYNVTGRPFDTKLDFDYGPNTHTNVYSHTRQFFLVQKSNGSLGIVWQDQEDNSIQVSWLGSDLQSQQTTELSYFPNEDLAAATTDGEGVIYYLTIQQGSGISESGGADIARMARLHKVNESGQVLTQTNLNTSEAGLNVVTFGKDNIASLKYSNGKLGLILGRRMHRMSDGLNHQGGIAVVFDANTLAVDKNWGQTSGHSFESILTINSQGTFVGIDLADNYPRGVHLHKFDQSQNHSRVVYTFKTEHGISATSPAGVGYPIYSEISGGGTTYYRWSNDNRTYTELGGVIEASNSYTVIFAGEATPDGRALDNARVSDYLNDPRNIGLVQVRSDFEQASGSGNVVTDDLVRTRGITETGGFYTFGGNWSEQRNTGVVWLTHYQDKARENVSRLKVIKLNDGNILLLWEKWTPDSYVNTYAMKVDEVGNPLTDIVELGTQVRLNRRDDAWQVGNAVYFVAGDRSEGKLELIVLKLE